jgi:hypothetical protein
MESSAILRLALQRSNELLQDKLRLMDERDMYKEAYRICSEALAMIAYPNEHKRREYLQNHHFNPDLMKQKTENDWHYLRMCDYEISEIAFNQALDVIRIRKPASLPPGGAGAGDDIPDHR